METMATMCYKFLFTISWDKYEHDYITKIMAYAILTSALYILISPWLTLDQYGTPLMFHNWFECSANGPVLTFLLTNGRKLIFVPSLYIFLCSWYQYYIHYTLVTQYWLLSWKQMVTKRSHEKAERGWCSIDGIAQINIKWTI